MLVDPRYVGTFVTVCRAGSFGRAASLLGRTQPAISHQIRMLEDELGAPLLERGPRRTVPTPLGRVVLEHAERFLTELAAVRDQARATRLRIASVSGYGRYVLFPALADAPGLCELLRYPAAPDVVAGVLAGEYDVGFVHVPPVARHLRAEPVARIEYLLVAPPRLPVPRAVDALGELPWIGYDECDYVFGRWCEAVLGRPPAQWRTVFHAEELEEALAMVAAGAGVTIMPAPVVAAALRGKRLRAVRPGRRRAWNTVFAIRRAAAPASAAIDQLLAALRG